MLNVFLTIQNLRISVWGSKLWWKLRYPQNRYETKGFVSLSRYQRIFYVTLVYLLFIYHNHLFYTHFCVLMRSTCQYTEQVLKLRSCFCFDWSFCWGSSNGLLTHSILEVELSEQMRITYSWSLFVRHLKCFKCRIRTVAFQDAWCSVALKMDKVLKVYAVKT